MRPAVLEKRRLEEEEKERRRWEAERTRVRKIVGGGKTSRKFPQSARGTAD
jgi:hypothetical protein